MRTIPSTALQGILSNECNIFAHAKVGILAATSGVFASANEHDMIMLVGTVKGIMEICENANLPPIRKRLSRLRITYSGDLLPSSCTCVFHEHTIEQSIPLPTL